jgi:GntR family transcriptional regulator
MKDSLIRDDRRPLYERAQSVIIARIVEGAYKPGDQLPPEDQLAAGLGVSRTTIRSALGNLETLGYIQRIHGAGTFVAHRRFEVEAQLDALESFHPRLAARAGRSSQIAHLLIREIQADAEIAGALGLRAGDPVISISRIVEFDSVPVVYLEDFLPESVITIAELQANFRDSVVDYFDGREGRPRAAWSDSHLGAARADDTQAGLLHIAKGSTLLRLDEGFFTADAALVSWSRNYIVPEYFKFHIRRRVIHEEAAASI